jgi:RNA 3'-terminal phosphate cyclase
VFATPEPESVGVSVTVCALVFQPEPIDAVLSVVLGSVESGVGVKLVVVPLLPATSLAKTPTGPGLVEVLVQA